MNRPTDFPSGLQKSTGLNSGASSLEEFKQFLSGIEDPFEREIAETSFTFGRAAATTERQQVAVLLHGIRTEAVWQEILADEFREKWNVEAYPIGYGVFDTLRFLFPFWTRQAPISRVTLELRNLRRKFPNAEISVIAHSFGTYILSHILSEHTDLTFHRIQLCGAVVSTNYRWDKVISRVKGQIVNDVGVKDMWPVLAKSSTWGFGESGAIGFKAVDVRDRFFDYGHSDFLTTVHARKYWIPFLLDGQIVPSPFTKKRKASGVQVWLLRFLPLKLLWIPVAIVLFKAFSFAITLLA
jgi:hypothetical protein